MGSVRVREWRGFWIRKSLEAGGVRVSDTIVDMLERAGVDVHEICVFRLEGVWLHI